MELVGVTSVHAACGAGTVMPVTRRTGAETAGPGQSRISSSPSFYCRRCDELGERRAFTCDGARARPSFGLTMVYRSVDDIFETIKSCSLENMQAHWRFALRRGDVELANLP